MATKISELPNTQAIKAVSGAVTYNGVIGNVTPAAATVTTLSATDDVTVANGKAIKTDTTTAHTLKVQAYDVDGTAYKDFITLTNGNTPAMAITAPSGGTITIDGAPIGGTTPSTGVFTTITGPLTGNADTATALKTARAIYGNNFDGSAALTQIIASTYGGTGNGFAKFSGPATSEKTFTLPNASATILTSNDVVTPAQGGTGIANNAASTITISGNFSTTLTVSGATSVTLPTSGTLTTLATVTSTANTFTAAQRGAFSALTDAGTVAIDLSLANNYNLVLGGNRTLGVPTNAVAGQTGAITVRQDITGSRTLSYAWPYVFPSGTAPTLSTGKLVMDQLYYCVNNYSTATVTVTIATPAVMTWTAHGLASGQRIQLTTTGALPTGLSINTTYWVTVIDANTFNLSTSLANAQTATFINTTGSQSGVHTATAFSITIANNLGLA